MACFLTSVDIENSRFSHGLTAEYTAEAVISRKKDEVESRESFSKLVEADSDPFVRKDADDFDLARSETSPFMANTGSRDT